MDLEAFMTMINKKFKASITVEAAFSFCITVFVLFLMLGPLLIIKTTSDLLIDLNEMSKIRCDYEMIKHNSDGLSIKEKIKNFINEYNIDIETINKIENTSNYVSFIFNANNKYDESKSEYKNVSFVYDLNPNVYDEATNIIRYDYVINFKLPYNILNVDEITKRLVSSRRAFVGSIGDRFDDESVDGDFVYVSNNYLNSNVYHTNINCTYLVKKTISFEYKNRANYRNDKNKNYSKCDYCFKNIKVSNETTCYATQYGDRFHYRPDCPVMTAYVTKLPKDKIDLYDLRACFRCANKGE